MDVMDWVILASMSVLVVFFASAAVMEWMDSQTGRWNGEPTHKSSSTLARHQGLRGLTSSGALNIGRPPRHSCVGQDRWKPVTNRVAEHLLKFGFRVASAFAAHART